MGQEFNGTTFDPLGWPLTGEWAPVRRFLSNYFDLLLFYIISTLLHRCFYTCYLENVHILMILWPVYTDIIAILVGRLVGWLAGGLIQWLIHWSIEVLEAYMLVYNVISSFVTLNCVCVQKFQLHQIYLKHFVWKGIIFKRLTLR